MKPLAEALKDALGAAWEASTTVTPEALIAAIRALDAAGWVCVPEKPTDAMFQAMSAPNGWDDQGDPCRATWIERWRAGLVARPRLPGVER